jgi:hypothetical protein
MCVGSDDLTIRCAALGPAQRIWRADFLPFQDRKRKERPKRSNVSAIYRRSRSIIALAGVNLAREGSVEPPGRRPEGCDLRHPCCRAIVGCGGAVAPCRGHEAVFGDVEVGRRDDTSAKTALPR